MREDRGLGHARRAARVAEHPGLLESELDSRRRVARLRLHARERGPVEVDARDPLETRQALLDERGLAVMKVATGGATPVAGSPKSFVA